MSINCSHDFPRVLTEKVPSSRRAKTSRIIMNLVRTGEERRQQTLCDKRDNNFV